LGDPVVMGIPLSRKEKKTHAQYNARVDILCVSNVFIFEEDLCYIMHMVKAKNILKDFF
jgi:hypothetical protein